MKTLSQIDESFQSSKKISRSWVVLQKEIPCEDTMNNSEMNDWEIIENDGKNTPTFETEKKAQEYIDKVLDIFCNIYYFKPAKIIIQ